MSADTSKSPVSTNGWIAAVLLTLLAFLFYYLPLPDGSIYTSLADQWEKNFRFQANDTNSRNEANSRCRVFLKGPKQVVDFQENEFTLVFQNSGGEDSESDGKDCKWFVRIIVNVEPEASILIPIEVVDVEAENQPTHIYTQQFPVEYDLKEFETKTILFHLLVPPGIYNLKRPVTITLQDLAKGGNISWDGDTGCTTQEGKEPKENKEKICLNLDLTNAIRESATKNLLLPPWSNRLIPFIAFAMVWLAEQLMPEQKKQQPNEWLLLLAGLGAYFLFLFYAILYFMLLRGELLEALLFAMILVLCIIALPKIFSRGVKRLRILLLLVIFILPIVSFFLLQSEKWRKVGITLLGVVIIILLLYLLWDIINSLWGWFKQIVLVKGGRMSEVIQKVIQRGRKKSHPLPIPPPTRTKECPDCHNPNVPEDAMYCPSCGHRFSP
jgi:hypothetical protein